MDKFDICVLIENELNGSKNRVVVVSTPLADEIATLLNGIYYVGRKNDTIIVSCSEELTREEMKK